MTGIGIAAVLVGGLAPLGRSGALSGIAKAPVGGPVRIGLLGLEGDAQADLRHHGGRRRPSITTPLSPSWRELAVRCLERGAVEAWRSRLDGPDAPPGAG